MSIVAFSLVCCLSGGALAADRVSVGTLGNNSDAGFLIAAAKGYFKAEGLDITFIPFDAAAQAIASLGTGALDVGGGSASAGLYNAAARGIDIRIVADRSRTAAHYNFQSIVIRKELAESGGFKSYVDLKGKRVAILAPGVTTLSVLNEAAKKGGIAYDDIEKVFLSFPQQIPAFANGAIDASIMIEPFTTAVITAGTAVRFASTEDFYPSYQSGVVFYSEKFAHERRDVATRFMKAYVQALRDYNDGVVDGRFTNDAEGDEIVAILASGLNIAPERIRAADTQAVDPDGRVNDAGLAKDLAFFKAQGDVTSKTVEVDQLLDMSFVNAAVKTLGPYRPAPR
jgi:NitT/TauT family transport system substrate-binding protein